MIERQDGPVKHYYATCDGPGCNKKTRRQAYDFDFSEFAEKGWKEVEDENEEFQHYCPKCASNTDTAGVKEVIPSVGDSEDISDHDAVHLPVKRVSKNELVIDLGNGCKWVITSNTAIRVEQHDE